MAASNPVFIGYRNTLEETNFKTIYEGIEDPRNTLPEIMIEAPRTGARQTTDPLDSLKFQGRSELGRNFGRMGVPAENSWIHAFLTCTSERFLLFSDEAKVEIVKKFRTVLRDMKISQDVSVAQFIVQKILPDTVKSVFPELDTLEGTINGEDEFAIGHGFAIAWFFGLNLVVLEEKDGSYEINCNTSYQSPSCPVIFMIHKNGRYEPVFQFFDSLADERNKFVFQWWDQALCTLKELSEKTCTAKEPFDQSWFLPQCEGEEVAAAGNGARSPGPNRLSLRGSPDDAGNEEEGVYESLPNNNNARRVAANRNASNALSNAHSEARGRRLLNGQEDGEENSGENSGENRGYKPPSLTGTNSKKNDPLEPANPKLNRQANTNKPVQPASGANIVLSSGEIKGKEPPLEPANPKLNRQANTNEPVAPAGVNSVLNSGEIKGKPQTKENKLRKSEKAATQRSKEHPEFHASTTANASGKELFRSDAPGRSGAMVGPSANSLRGKKNAAAAARKTRRNRRQTR